MKTNLAAALLASGAAASLVTGFVLPATPARAVPVFDATNYAQNLLQAARALSQINNQIRSLQNEAAMLQNMARNLSRLDFPQLQRITEALTRIEQLMGEARAIGFRVDALDERFRSLFPNAANESLGRDARLSAARARVDAAMDSFRQAMGVQAQVVENVAGDAQLLAELAAASQGAEGSLQATQATNQLLALAAKQQFQLQSMMAAQFRSDSLERARRLQAERDARAAARRFLGSGRAYTPR